MGMYVQRYPFAPKAVWWKRYTDNASIGKRVVYKATNEIGFEIDGIPQTFQKRALINGKIKVNEQVEYIDLTGKAVRLLGVIYQYDSTTQSMQLQDLGDEDLEVIQAEIGDKITFEKNSYIRKYRFDCIKDSDQQDSMHQPISGLLSNTSYLTIKIHNFSSFADKPAIGDILYYQGCFWMIEEVNKIFVYTPRERMVLQISIKQIHK